MNVADFREEVLKIKREKHKTADDLKIKEEEYGNFKSRLDVLNTANAAQEKACKDKSYAIDLRNAELSSTKRDYEC